MARKAKQPKRWVRAVKIIGFSAYCFFGATFGIFCLFELFPSLLDRINLQAIPYYAQRQQYVYDPVLIFKPRKPAGTFSTDQYEVGVVGNPTSVDPQYIHYEASFTELGFRTNSSSPPYEIAVLGDSFIEIGESDTKTLSEQIKQKTQQSTFNLGRGWYGPPQYLEVFKRYAVPLHPKIALFCIFTGNDIWDTVQYLGWLNGRHYYKFALDRKNFVERYWTATSDSFSFFGSRLFHQPMARLETPSDEPDASAAGGGDDPEIGVMNFHGQRLRVKFTYRYGDLTFPIEELRKSNFMAALENILLQFKQTSAQENIRPIVVLIPSSVHLYPEYLTKESGRAALNMREQQLKFRGTTRKILNEMLERQAIETIDLFPPFEDLTKRGELLYYTHDNHWNARGIERAAEIIARHLAAAR